jgi:hypothetical protein
MDRISKKRTGPANNDGLSNGDVDQSMSLKRAGTGSVSKKQGKAEKGPGDACREVCSIF